MAEPGPASSAQIDDDRSTWLEVDDATRGAEVVRRPIGGGGRHGRHRRLHGVSGPGAGADGAQPVAAGLTSGLAGGVAAARRNSEPGP